MPVSQAGVTLIELLVTLSIAAILMVVAAPGIRDFIENSQLNSQINCLLWDLQYARSEAVKQGIHVSVCKAAVGNCGTAESGWENGWIVFVNADNDSPTVLDAGEATLKTASALRKEYTLRADAALNNYVTFSPTGVPHVSGLFVLCKDDNVVNSRALFISPAGRISVGDDTNGNRIPEMPDPTQVTDVGTCIPWRGAKRPPCGE